MNIHNIGIYGKKWLQSCLASPLGALERFIANPYIIAIYRGSSFVTLMIDLGRETIVWEIK